jgi:hypothetical protein
MDWDIIREIIGNCWKVIPTNLAWAFRQPDIRAAGIIASILVTLSLVCCFFKYRCPQ